MDHHFLNEKFFVIRECLFLLGLFSVFRLLHWYECIRYIIVAEVFKHCVITPTSIIGMPLKSSSFSSCIFCLSSSPVISASFSPQLVVCSCLGNCFEEKKILAMMLCVMHLYQHNTHITPGILSAQMWSLSSDGRGRGELTNQHIPRKCTDMLYVADQRVN